MAIAWTAGAPGRRGAVYIVTSTDNGATFSTPTKVGKLLKQRRDFQFVLIAADPVPEEPKQMMATLTKAGLGSVENWMFADRFADRLRFEIDPNWAGELPLTVFMARDGKTTSTLGTVDFATIRAWLDAQR